MELWTLYLSSYLVGGCFNPFETICAVVKSGALPQNFGGKNGKNMLFQPQPGMYIPRTQIVSPFLGRFNP